MHRLFLVAMLAAACAAPSGSKGTLLLVGGGLDDDARPVYERLLGGSSPRVVVATAATGPQEVEATDKSEALRAWAPAVAVDVVRRETTAADTVAALARASAVFFTGGDQKRITARYRPDDQPGPEWHALQELLARGGVLGGGSAGCAMMGERMLLGGRSEQALGIAAADDGGEPVPLGPRLGPGMGFLPGVLTDSHFFERDRVGRLVAALGRGPDRLGLGVGEDAAVAVDVASRTVTGVTAAETLFVDATFARRVGSDWVGLRARVIGQGDRVVLAPLGSTAPDALPRSPVIAHEVPVVEPGQNRQLASWRIFRQAVPGAGVLRLRFAGWSVLAQAEANGVVVFEVRVGGD
jgi:cyanophycinase